MGDSIWQLCSDTRQQQVGEMKTYGEDLSTGLKRLSPMANAKGTIVLSRTIWGANRRQLHELHCQIASRHLRI